MTQEVEWAEQVEQRKKWLAEPFMIMFDDNTFRIRRNLLAVSVITLVFKFAATGINTIDSSFLGVKLDGLNTDSVNIILLLMVLYFLIHFLWSGWDKFIEWKLRLTGMNVAKPNHGLTFSDGVQAGADIQEQSTLSSWWVSNIKQFDEIKFLVDEKDKLISIENASDLKASINIILSRQKQLQERTIHIEAAIQNYDKGFKTFLISQQLRWIIMEFMFPILLSICAVVMLIIRW